MLEHAGLTMDFRCECIELFRGMAQAHPYASVLGWDDSGTEQFGTMASTLKTSHEKEDPPTAER